MKKRSAISFALLASILAFLVAPGIVSQREIAGSPAPNSDPIRIGVYADLTGQTSSFGISTEKGVKLAVEEINRAGGIDGRPIEVIVRDDQGLPNGAATVVEQLIEEDRVVALIGEVASTNSLAAAPVAQRARIPMISPASTNPKVTQVGNYIFRAAFIDPMQGWGMAKFARETLRAKTVAIFGDVYSDYSKGLTKYFIDEFVGTGGRIVSEQFYANTDSDFRAQLRAIRRARPDVIYVPGYYSQAGVIVKQARRMGMRQPFMGGDGWDSPRLMELAGPTALNNTYISNHYAADDPTPAVRDFATRYARRYDEAPDSLAALAYDTMNLLADALRRAGTTEGRKLREAIAQTRNFHGVTGDITLDAERNPIKPVIILKYFNGQYVHGVRMMPAVTP